MSEVEDKAFEGAVEDVKRSIALSVRVHIAVKEGENPMFRPEHVIRSMDENGIDKIVCFTFGTGLEDQKRLAEAIAPYRNRMIPLAYVGPREKDCGAQLLYCLDRLNFQGVKLHPYVSKQYDPAQAVC